MQGEKTCAHNLADMDVSTWCLPCFSVSSNNGILVTGDKVAPTLLPDLALSEHPCRDMPRLESILSET